MMLGQQWLRYAVVVCLLSVSDALWAGYPIVGRSGGLLAVRAAADQEWRVTSAGHIAPDLGEARTATGGPGHIQADQGTLSVGPLSHVNYDLTARRVELLTGRAYCVPTGDQSWTMSAGTARVQFPAGSAAEVEQSEQGLLIVTVAKGEVEVSFPDQQPLTLSAQTRTTFGGTPFAAETKPLEPAAEVSLRKWTRILPIGQGLGQLVIKDAEAGSMTRLNIARYHAEVVLQPPVALVKLDQSFYNPYNNQAEGEFIFNLPQGASVSRFAMFVTPTELIEGEVIERQQADQVYTTIVRSRRDPAILEQIGDNLFKMRVFPIFPRDVKRILLDFTLPLDQHGGQYEMQLPLLSNLKPIWDFRLFGAIRGPTPLASVQCPTLPNVKFVAKDANEIAFDYRRSNYQPESDFVVSFQQPQPQSNLTFRRLAADPLKLPEQAANNVATPRASLNADGSLSAAWGDWNSKPGTYFQADLPVPKELGQDSPADVLILVDTSANGTLDQIRPALQTTVGGLRAGDRLRLVAVDVVARPLHEGWLLAGSPQVKSAMRNFEQQICIGATDMLVACQAAGTEFDGLTPDRRHVVIYIGDGLDVSNRYSQQTLVERCAAEIANANAVLHTVNVLPPPLPPAAPTGQRGFGGGFFQFGSERPSDNPSNAARSPGQKNPVDGRLLLTRLSRAAAGRSYDFWPDASTRGAYFEFVLAGAPTPARIQKLAVAGCEPIEVYYPDSLMSGEPLRVVGRRLGPIEQLEVAYELVTGPGKSHILNTVLSPQSSTQDHMVGRHWANQRLRHLQRIMAAPRDAGGNPDATHAIVQLSREWSLLTPQTAFLVLETEADYQRWNVPRQARRRYWSTDELPPVPPLPADWLARVTPARLRALNKQQTQILDAQVTEQLAAARKAVESGLDERAARLLTDLGQNDIARQTEEFRTLSRMSANLRRTGNIVQRLGIRKSWFDLDQTGPTLPLSLDRLLISTSLATPALLQRHPQAEALFQEIDVPVGEMSLADFAHFLKTRLQTNVTLDRHGLEEENISPDQILKLPSLSRISVHSAIHHVLREINCGYIEEPFRLLITTSDRANRDLSSRNRLLLPIDDLITERPQIDFEDLQDPLFNIEEGTRQRVEMKLQKLTSLRMQDASLVDVAARFRKLLDENIVIDEAKLKEESVASESMDFSCDYANVPAGELLTWLLDSKNLTYMLDHEALILTTKTEGISMRPIRLYPGAGLIFRDKNPRPNPMPGGGGWVGGGWGMGFGGMMGGMGGGFAGGGGFGGFGGGGGFGGADSSGASLPGNPIGVSSDGPPTDSDDETTPAPDGEDAVTADLDQGAAIGLDGVDVYSVIQAIEQQTGGLPDSPWLNADGEGGGVEIFYPGLTFVIRQTPQAHREIANFFKQQRELQARRGHHPQMVLVTAADQLTRGDEDVYDLIRLLQQTTGGAPDSPWLDLDGEGGSITYDRARKALSVRQNLRTLDDICSLLVQLRRERYAVLHGSRPWEGSQFLSRQPALLMGTWQNLATATEVVGQATEGELATLQVRRELPQGEWKWTSAARGPVSQFALNTAEDRLRLVWPGWEIRAKGATSSVIATELRYAELGNWSPALREWLDVELPFWPHRSNRDLATLFNVAVVIPAKPVDPNQLQVRFTPADAGESPLWIDVTYDKATGLPILWESFKQSILVQRARFETVLADGKPARLKVRRETPGGHLLSTGEWTLVTNQAAPIADPDALPAEVLRVDRRPQTRASLTVLEAGLQFTRKGQHQQAAAEYRKVLDQQPDQPLVQFLWAWSLGKQIDGVSRDRLLAAYAPVMEQGTSELGRLLIQHAARQLTDRDLYDLLSARPAANLSVSDQLLLARLALRFSQPQQALPHATAVWEQPAEAATHLEAAQILIESHFRLRNPQAAYDFYDRFRKFQVGGKNLFTVEMLSQLLNQFEYFPHAHDTTSFYQDLLSRQDPSLTPELKRSLLKRLADRMQGLKRWQALLAALELLPPGSKDAATEFAGMLSEITEAHDDVASVTLAAQARQPRHRQQLRMTQANLLPNDETAQDIYWRLHQQGFIFRDYLLMISDRMLAADHPDRAAAIIEAAYRQHPSLTTLERVTLAKAYELLARPLDARRAISDEPR